MTFGERFSSGGPVTGIGLMSGTSADGIDAAVVDLWEEGGRLHLRTRASLCLPYPDDVREELFACFDNRSTPAQVCVLNAVVGELFASAAERAVREAGLPEGAAHFVASHGQTVWHEPAVVTLGGVSVRSTLQIGEAARIAERLRVPVVSDFRHQDIAAGGQGAPLVPYLDLLLFSDPLENRAVQNLGGIGNVTYLPAGGAADAVVAFDTGPANALIDEAVLLLTGGADTCDRDGRIAASAPVNPGLLGRLMAEPYLHQPPPKSTGRELFSAARVKALWDEGFRGPELVSTLTQYTVETVAAAYRDWLGPLDRVIVGGGGARNHELLRRLADALAPVPVQRIDEFGVDGDAKEAVAFAVFGYRTLRGQPSNVPSATGASRPVVQGKITLP